MIQVCYWTANSQASKLYLCYGRKGMTLDTYRPGSNPVTLGKSLQSFEPQFPHL